MREKPLHTPASDNAPIIDAPTHRPLLMGVLALCLIVGLFLGPWGMERVAGPMYDAVFVGGAEPAAALESFDHDALADRHQLVATDVSAVAIAEWDERMQAQRAPLQLELQMARRDRAVALRYLIFGLLAFAFALGVLEAALSPRSPRLQWPLRLASYTAFALALLVVGARPALLGLVPTVVFAAAVVLALSAAALAYRAPGPPPA